MWLREHDEDAVVLDSPARVSGSEWGHIEGLFIAVNEDGHTRRTKACIDRPNAKGQGKQPVRAVGAFSKRLVGGQWAESPAGLQGAIGRDVALGERELSCTRRQV